MNLLFSVFLYIKKKKKNHTHIHVLLVWILAHLPYILSPFADLVGCVVISFTLGDRELFTSRVLMIDWVLTVFIKSDTIWKYRSALSAPAGAVSQTQEGLFWSAETEINSNLNRVTRVCVCFCVFTQARNLVNILYLHWSSLNWPLLNIGWLVYLCTWFCLCKSICFSWPHQMRIRVQHFFLFRIVL